MDARTEAALRAGRPTYLYSVIPGGAYTPEELHSAIAEDIVVARHYADVSPDAARAEVVADDRLVYVSYRKDGSIYWTKNKVRLRRGETILTDGTSAIRARCGNRISTEAMAPVSEAEPDPVIFDRLLDDDDVGPAAASERPAAGADLLLSEPLSAGVRPTATMVSSPLASRDRGVADPAPGIATPSDPDPLVDDPSRTPGDPSPAPGTNPPPAPPTRDDGPLDAGPDPVSTPPGLLDPLPGIITEDPPDQQDPLVLVPGQDWLNPETPDGPPGWYGGDPGAPLAPVNPVPVPEPGTLLLVGGGAVALLRKLRARR
jgi:hypothetical protein